MTTMDSTAEADREIILTREYDAPRALVWRAYTDPAHVPHWWGPDGFHNTVHEIDVRPGGRWRFTMHAPDGTEYSNRITYRELVAPERIEFLYGEDLDDDPGAFQVTVTFDELSAIRTRVTQRMLFNTAAQRDGALQYGASELGQQTLNKLAEHLKTMGG